MRRDIICRYCRKAKRLPAVGIFGSGGAYYVACSSCGTQGPWMFTKGAAEEAWRLLNAPDAVWVSVAEKLPGDDRMVLVWAVTKSGKGSINRARYSDGFWHGSGSMAGVTHWMELPNGPEGECGR